MSKQILKGAPVIDAMKEDLIERVDALKEVGVEPTMCILRVGARPDDLSYERGARKRLESVGIALKVEELPEDVDQAGLEESFRRINDDAAIHGIMVFRPLPKHLSEEPIARMIRPEKDMDCMSPVNIAKVFSGDETGYAPCTAQAVMEMIEHNQIDLTGKKVTIVGRSMVVGKPLSMLMLKKNATVTLCHTRTENLAKECQAADLLCAAAGKAGMVGADFVREGQTVIDVGINVNEEGKLCGDVDFDEVEPLVEAITPVPGGVGGVTSVVLAKHVVEAAERQTKK